MLVCALFMLSACNAGLEQQLDNTLEPSALYFSQPGGEGAQGSESTNNEEGVAPGLLDGSTVSGTIYIIIDAHQHFSEVRFILDNSQIKDDKDRPFDLHLDTTEMTDGQHTLTVLGRWRSGKQLREVASATFVVDNSGPQPNEGETVQPAQFTLNISKDGLGTGTVTGSGIDCGSDCTEEYDEGASVTLQANPAADATFAGWSGACTGTGSCTVIINGAKEVNATFNQSRSNDPNAIYVTPNDSLSAALRTALDRRAQGHSTRIILRNGVYRQALVGYYSSSGATITFEAENLHGAIISGSDVWTEWNCSTTCTKHWPHKWGVQPNPWPERSVSELGLRREMVFVNGERLRQVLYRSEMVPGTYFVDENAELLHVHPPSGIDLNKALVEVSLRPHLVRLQALNDFELRGLVLQHAATPLKAGWSEAVHIVDQSRVLIENILVTQNNWNGFTLQGYDITIRRSQMLHNGFNGFGGNQGVRVLAEDIEASYNNWRGNMGGIKGWSVGNKIFKSRDFTLRRYRAVGNLSRGLWLDWDNKNVTLEDSYICDNLRDGVFLEISQGPIVVRNNTICNNGRHGIQTSALNHWLLEGNHIYGNAEEPLKLTGGFDVKIREWDTGITLYLRNSNWTWRNNHIEGTDITKTTWDQSQFNELLTSSQFDHNRYYPSSDRPFKVYGGLRWTFTDWQKNTTQDQSSVANYQIAQ